MPDKRAQTALAIMCILFSTSCVVNPKYARPSVPTPAAYKETASTENTAWKLAQPSDAVLRGRWWEEFHEDQLNNLEEELGASNQNIAAAASKLLAARAEIRQARSQYAPSASIGAGATNSRLATFGPNPAGVSFSTYSLPVDASWEPDVWGRVRHMVLANSFATQASAADLESVRLSAQAELAIDYFQLRTQDALERLLRATVVTYEDTLRLAKAQYTGGIGTDEAVAQAETQLRAAEAELLSIGIVRAEYEHAIAVLTGRNPSSFSITKSELPANPPPAIPLALPSALLERRPDIATAERLAAQANEQIGIAKTAFYPNISLSGSIGFTALGIGQWLTWPSRVWSVGPAISETVFDAGLRRAVVLQYRASYEATIAQYRQTVLTAFQEVEDNLASLRILPQQIAKQTSAVEAAQRALHEAVARYRGGLDPYLNVLTAQTALLNNQQTVTNLQMQQWAATIQLIKALGGGWNVSQIPSIQALRASPDKNQTVTADQK